MRNRKLSINKIEIIDSQIKTLKCDLILQRIDALAHVGGIVALTGLTFLTPGMGAKIITLFANGVCLSSTVSLNERIKINKSELSELESERELALNGKSL